MCKCLSKIHISIHLTLMLITKRQSFIIAHTDFNTSHVNVNRWKALIFHLSKTNFNTSHVNVNHTVITKERRIYIISIHLMLMLIYTGYSMWTVSSWISIHLMLMLIFKSKTWLSCQEWISIHLMLMLIINA